MLHLQLKQTPHDEKVKINSKNNIAVSLNSTSLNYDLTLIWSHNPSWVKKVAEQIKTDVYFNIFFPGGRAELSPAQTGLDLQPGGRSELRPAAEAEADRRTRPTLPVEAGVVGETTAAGGGRPPRSQQGHGAVFAPAHAGRAVGPCRPKTFVAADEAGEGVKWEPTPLTNRLFIFQRLILV